MSHRHTGRRAPGETVSRNPTWLSSNDGLLISCPSGKAIVVCDILVSSGSGKKLGTGINGTGDLIAYVSAGSSHSKIPITVPKGESVYTDASAYITITYYFTDGSGSAPDYGPVATICLSGSTGTAADKINGTYDLQPALYNGKVWYKRIENSVDKGIVAWQGSEWSVEYFESSTWVQAYNSPQDLSKPYDISLWTISGAGVTGSLSMDVNPCATTTTIPPTTTPAPFSGADCNSNVASLAHNPLPNGPITDTWQTTGVQSQAVWNVATVWEFTVSAGAGAGKLHTFSTLDAGVKIDSNGNIISTNECDGYGIPGPYGGMHNFDIWMCLHTQAGVLVDSNDDYPTQSAGYDSDKYGSQVSGTLAAGNYYLSVVAFSATGGGNRCPQNPDPPGDQFPADYIIAYGYDSGNGRPACGDTCAAFTTGANDFLCVSNATSSTHNADILNDTYELQYALVNGKPQYKTAALGAYGGEQARIEWTTFGGGTWTILHETGAGAYSWAFESNEDVHNPYDVSSWSVSSGAQWSVNGALGVDANTCPPTTTTASPVSSLCVAGSPYTYMNVTWTPTGQSCGGKPSWTNGGTGAELLYMFWDDHVIPGHWCISQVICDCNNVWYRTTTTGDSFPWLGTWTGLTVSENACTTTAAPVTTTAAPTTTTTAAPTTTTAAPVQSTLSITNPSAATYDDVGSVPSLVVAITGNTHDHWHWRLDSPFPASGAAGGNMVTSGSTATITGLTTGVHTIYVALVDANHNLLSPSVTASHEFLIGPTKFVEGIVPDWMQPPFYDGAGNVAVNDIYNSSDILNGLAWCSPTAAACQLGHLNNYWNIIEPSKVTGHSHGISDLIDAGAQNSANHHVIGIGTKDWASNEHGWGDHLIDKPNDMGGIRYAKDAMLGADQYSYDPLFEAGLCQLTDFGWFMNTNDSSETTAFSGQNRTGLGIIDLSPIGTTIDNIYNGLKDFYRIAGYTNLADDATQKMVGIVYHRTDGTNWKQAKGRLPAYWDDNGHDYSSPAGIIGVNQPTEVWNTIKQEIDQSRTVIACMQGWDLTLAGYSLPSGFPNTLNTVEKTMNWPSPDGSDFYGINNQPASNTGWDGTPYTTHDESTPDAEHWSGNALGHTVLIVGYIPRGAADDVSPAGDTDWLIVRDNHQATQRNVIIPFDSNTKASWAGNTTRWAADILMATIYVNPVFSGAPITPTQNCQATTTTTTTTTAAPIASFCISNSGNAAIDGPWYTSGACGPYDQYTNNDRGGYTLYMSYESGASPVWKITNVDCFSASHTTFATSDSSPGNVPWYPDTTWSGEPFAGYVDQGACVPANICIQTSGSGAHSPFNDWAMNTTWIPNGTLCHWMESTEYANAEHNSGILSSNNALFLSNSDFYDKWMISSTSCDDAGNNEVCRSDGGGDNSNPWGETWSTCGITVVELPNGRHCYPDGTQTFCIDLPGYASVDTTWYPWNKYDGGAGVKPVWWNQYANSIAIFMWHTGTEWIMTAAAGVNVDSGWGDTDNYGMGGSGSYWAHSDTDGANPWDADWSTGITSIGGSISGPGDCS